MNKRIVVLVLCILYVFISLSYANAVTVVIKRNASHHAIEDTQLHKNAPVQANNYGIYTSATRIGRNNANDLTRILIRPNVTDTSFIPAGATISRVLLNLTVGSCVVGQYSDEASSLDLELYRMTADWWEGVEDDAVPDTENGSTWDKRQDWDGGTEQSWSAEGGYSDTTGAESANGTGNPYNPGVANATHFIFDSDQDPLMLTDVNSWYNGSLANYGWMLKEYEDTDSNRIRIIVSECYSEGSYDNFIPSLTVTYSTGADITAPTITINSPIENRTYSSSSVLLNWSADETVGWVGYSLDGGDNVTVSSMCYQEHANVSYQCGAIGNGSYYIDSNWLYNNGTSVIDGSWSTSAYHSASVEGYLYMNYTKPIGALDTSKWLVKDGKAEINLSITSACWEQSTLQLQVISLNNPDGVQWSCYNGTSYDILRKFEDNSTPRAHEEAMFWNISATNTTDLIGLADGTHNITVYANDSSGNMGESSLRTFVVDATFPNSASSLEANNTIFYNDFVAHFNYTDNIKLFSFNITAQDYYNSTLNVNTTFYQHNVSFMLENYTVGMHTINTTFCDSHTKKEIPDYDYELNQTKKEVKYKFGQKELKIYPKSTANFDNVTTTKSIDRYKITFNKKKSKEDKEDTYIVEGDDLHIIGDTTYEGWIVDYGNKKWIDFQTPEDYPAEVLKVSKNKVEVTVKGENFNSVGDLNCNNASYKFYKFNYTLEYNSSIYETDKESYILKLNITDIPITASNARLIHNGTVYSPTSSTGTESINFTQSITFGYINVSSETYSLYYNFSLNGFMFNTSTNTQTIYQYYIGNCGGITNTTAINFTGYDEVTDAKINTTFLAYFQVYTESPSNYRNFSFNYSSSPSHIICIDPPSGEYYTDFITQYERTGYATRNIVKRNYTLKANGTFPLYLLSSGNATTVTVHLTDDIDNKYPNLLVEMQYFDIGNSTFKLVESKISNSEGIATFSVNYAKSYYLFSIYEGQKPTLVKQDADMYQINSLNLYYQIYTESSESLVNWITFRDITTSWNYDNATQNLTLSWGELPSSVSTVNMQIKYGNGTTLFSASSTQPSTTLSYNFSNIFNDSIIALGYFTSTDSINYPAIDPFSLDLSTDPFGDEPMTSLGIGILTYLVIGTLAFINPIAGIIGSVLGIVIISIFKLIPMLETNILFIITIGILIIAMMARRLIR